MAEEKALTQIKNIAARHFKNDPKGTRESNDWFKVWKLADEGDARTLSDEPTVAKAKRAAKKTTNRG
jgi:hypothetical protein